MNPAPRVPNRSTSCSLSTVANWDTFTTDSRSRPPVPAGKRTFPGRRATRRLVVIAATRTVRIADRLKLSAEITSAGRWKAGAEPRAGPKSAHHTSPRPITLPFPTRELATRRLGDERLRCSLFLGLLLGHR